MGIIRMRRWWSVVDTQTKESSVRDKFGYEATECM